MDDHVLPLMASKTSEFEPDDPGIIIILEDNDSIHRCLQLLPGIPSLNVGYPVPDPVAGANAAASRTAFTTWLDAVMLHICPNCIVLDLKNNRQEGWLQMLKLDEFIKATSFMSGLQDWARMPDSCSFSRQTVSHCRGREGLHDYDAPYSWAIPDLTKLEFTPTIVRLLHFHPLANHRGGWVEWAVHMSPFCPSPPHISMSCLY